MAACNDGQLVPEQNNPDPEPTATPTPAPPGYLGKEFVAVDLDNADASLDPINGTDAAAAQFAVAVSNPSEHESVDVTISTDGNEVMTGTVGPQELELFKLPRADVEGTTAGGQAYHIEAERPVTAHQFNPLEQPGVVNDLGYSTDTSLLLPTTALESEYWVMSWPQASGLTGDGPPGFFTVVAAEEGTTQVTLTAGGDIEGGDGIPALSAGESHTVELSQYDVVNLQSTNGSDLTGSHIEADQPVVAFGGHECANVPTSVGACDHLEQQLLATSHWGKQYVAAKSQARGSEPDIWRIMAAEDGTSVSTNPQQSGTPVTLNAGEFLEIETDEDFVVLADKPVMLGQYLVGECFGDPTMCENPAAGTGDPAFMITAPMEQFREDYIFLTPLNYEFDSITVVAPQDTEVTLNGSVIGEAAWRPVSGASWQVAVQDVEDGTHRIEGDKPFAVTVTGYDEYVSYGYPGGLNLHTAD